MTFPCQISFCFPGGSNLNHQSFPCWGEPPRPRGTGLWGTAPSPSPEGRPTSLVIIESHCADPGALPLSSTVCVPCRTQYTQMRQRLKHPHSPGQCHPPAQLWGSTSTLSARRGEPQPKARSDFPPFPQGDSWVLIFHAPLPRKRLGITPTSSLASNAGEAQTAAHAVCSCAWTKATYTPHTRDSTRAGPSTTSHMRNGLNQRHPQAPGQHLPGSHSKSIGAHSASPGPVAASCPDPDPPDSCFQSSILCSTSAP